MKTFIRLVEIMATLRSDKGCPWDQEQDHQSIRNSVIEEAYELLDAFDQDDPEMIKEELGDVLLQVVFHAQMESEAGRFTIDDVCATIGDKLVRRHPHVFGDADCATPAEVLRNWEKIKQAERALKKSKTNSLLDGVPRHMPALLQAHLVQSRAARVGFDWDRVEDAAHKLGEELLEFQQACSQEDTQAVFDELGDILFSVVNVARFVNVDPEEALGRTTKRFMERFKDMESQVQGSGRAWEEFDSKELDCLWEAAKLREQNNKTKRG